MKKKKDKTRLFKIQCTKCKSTNIKIDVFVKRKTLIVCKDCGRGGELIGGEEIPIE